MSEITQPHDRFFGKIFSRMDIVEDILFNNIPAIATHLLPGSLEDCRDTFVNPELGKYYSDLLLKAKFKNGESVYIYILLEHKSYHELEVAYDLLRYILQIWETVKEKGKRLPFIFPVVIYHGKKKWSSDPHFSALVDIPVGLEAYAPAFRYYLYDLSRYSDAEIKGTILSRVVLLLFKHIFAEDFGERFVRICELLGKLQDEKTALEFMRSVLEYIGNATDRISREQIRKGVEKALPQAGGKLMPTLFEQIREEGRVEGRVEGREEGQGLGRLEGLREGIELALELKFGEEGLSLLPEIRTITSIEILHEIKDVLKTGYALNDIKKLLNQ
ncbi:MAG: hypothetical protein C4527_21300 [Candidatus Omnitrophota bacterium]|nr:MAG: hypothetical protein C4527_21300 [Candidatus Omnitrophota bacterium]